MLSIDDLLKVQSKGSNGSDSGGYARFVFPVTPDIVVKLPHNFFTFECIDQSWGEYYFYQELLTPEFERFVPRLYDVAFIPIPDRYLPIARDLMYDQDLHELPVLFVERVAPLSEWHLEELGFDDIFEIIELWYGYEVGREFINDLKNFCRHTGVVDIYYNITNWGVNAAGHLVILDLGLNSMNGSPLDALCMDHYTYSGR